MWQDFCVLFIANCCNCEILGQGAYATSRQIIHLLASLLFIIED